jgi:hypothetical protein
LEIPQRSSLLPYPEAVARHAAFEQGLQANGLVENQTVQID